MGDQNGLVVVTPQQEQTALVRRHAGDVALTPVMDVPMALGRLKQLQDFCASYLQKSQDGGADGGDYGVIPGAGQKKVLLKSGAEKLCDIYGLADRYRILTKTEDFEHGLFDYTIECELVRKTDEMFVGSGLGSCSSYESKYRWRDEQRKCPKCGASAIIKGKEEYGGGWLCWKKKSGCGATFLETDATIVDQKTGRVENPDIIDTKNTVLKMAKKRAKIDAVIGVTRSSGIFTQDLEDHLQVEPPEAPPTKAPAKPAPKLAPSPTTTGTVVQGTPTPTTEPAVTVLSLRDGKDAKGPFIEASLSDKRHVVTRDSDWTAKLAEAVEENLPVHVTVEPRGPVLVLTGLTLERVL